MSPTREIYYNIHDTSWMYGLAAVALAVLSAARFEPDAPAPATYAKTWDAGEAMVEIVRGRLEALVTRALYYDLVELAAPRDARGETFGVWSGGVWFELSGAAG